MKVLFNLLNKAIKYKKKLKKILIKKNLYLIKEKINWRNY